MSAPGRAREGVRLGYVLLGKVRFMLPIN